MFVAVFNSFMYIGRIAWAETTVSRFSYVEQRTISAQSYETIISKNRAAVIIT
jgi:hypothetical protein